MVSGKLRNIKYLAPIGGLYVFDVVEFSLLGTLALAAPKFFLPVAILTQLISLIASIFVARLIWKKPAQRVLGLLQNRIATWRRRGRSHRPSEGQI